MKRSYKYRGMIHTYQELDRGGQLTGIEDRICIKSAADFWQRRRKWKAGGCETPVVVTTYGLMSSLALWLTGVILMFTAYGGKRNSEAKDVPSGDENGELFFAGGASSVLVVLWTSRENEFEAKI